jgi:copper homeostasis protein (lipoprotein)
MKNITKNKIGLPLVIALCVFIGGLSSFITSYVFKQQILTQLPLKTDEPEKNDNADQSISQPPIPQSQTFDGTLPCADCSGLKTQLILQKDPQDPTEGVYTLQETYEGKSSNPVITLGKWDVVKGTSADPQAIVIKLKIGEQTTGYWLVVDNNTLEMLDMQKNHINSPFNLKLTRRQG